MQEQELKNLAIVTSCWFGALLTPDTEAVLTYASRMMKRDIKDIRSISDMRVEIRERIKSDFLKVWKLDDNDEKVFVPPDKTPNVTSGDSDDNPTSHIVSVDLPTEINAALQNWMVDNDVGEINEAIVKILSEKLSVMVIPYA